MHALASRGGAWVAAGAGNAVARASSWLKPLHPEPDILSAHRDGYCANTLAHMYLGHEGTTPSQNAEWASAHRLVSLHYAHHIAALAAPGAVVWIHDYPLQLVPSALRELRPDLRIGYSLHSPFPAAGTLLTVAEHDQILSSLLACDLVGFPDIRSEANFASYSHTAGLPVARSTVMPIPVETHAIAQLAATTMVQAQAARIRHRLRPATTILLAVGADDPGDGTLTVLGEYQQLLATQTVDPQRTALIHLTRPGGAAESHETRQDTERLIAQINGNHSVLGQLPVQHQRGPFTPEELTAFYLAADVMLAMPTRDRATFEAPEYVTARTSGTGRLILSEFSTATGQVPAAHLINPHVPGALAEALAEAMSETSRRSPRMSAMREQALGNNVSGWIQNFLYALAGNVSTATAPAGVVRTQTRRRHTGHPTKAGSRLAATGSHP